MAGQPLTARKPVIRNSGMSAQRYEFQTETKRLLDLMINSLYSNKDIFLRELVSNASDALDRRRFAAVTKPELLAADEDLEIRLQADTEARTLSVSDNGIGMSRDEVISNLGTIARSGTAEFSELLAAGEESADVPELIGQFGVGFYSSFLVADNVTVVTRKAGEAKATRWQSDGSGSYTIDDAERDGPGTTITLHLKSADDDAGLGDYTTLVTVRRVVKHYSDFVSYPIQWIDSKAEGDAEPQTLNSMKAIWARPESEVSGDEYNEFYKHISHDWTEPLLRLSTRIEGTFEARSLLFVPSRAPFDLFMPEATQRGIQLYIKRVFIMDECEQLIPRYLRFVKGVVDAEDLPLNVSREILQQNRQIRAIRKHLTKKVLDRLNILQRDELAEYKKFWTEFGAVLKEGLLYSQERDERIYDLVLCESTRESGELTTLEDYVDRMSEDQDVIYVITARTAEAARRSPHLEAFRDKGVDVLIFTDPVDEVWLNQNPEYQGKNFRSVGQGEIDLEAPKGCQDETAAAQKDEQPPEYGELLLALRAALQDQVKDVRMSKRLRSSAVCLVTDEGDITPELERLMRASGQKVGNVKRILELNPKHPVVEKLSAMFADSSSNPLIGDYAKLLYGQAVLAEGGELDEPGEFARLIADLMVRAG